MSKLWNCKTKAALVTFGIFGGASLILFGMINYPAITAIILFSIGGLSIITAVYSSILNACEMNESDDNGSDR